MWKRCPRANLRTTHAHTFTLLKYLPQKKERKNATQWKCNKCIIWNFKKSFIIVVIVDLFIYLFCFVLFWVLRIRSVLEQTNIALCENLNAKKKTSEKYQNNQMANA